MTDHPLVSYPVRVERAVDWGEMDVMGHVNNVVYFRWFESGRAAYFAIAKMIEDGPRGVAPILHSVACRFRRPVRYPDQVTVGVRVKDIRVDRFTFEHVVWSERCGQVAAQGDGLVVAFDYDSGKKAPIPETWLQAFERLQPSVSTLGSANG